MTSHVYCIENSVLVACGIGRPRREDEQFVDGLYSYVPFQ